MDKLNNDSYDGLCVWQALVFVMLFVLFANFAWTLFLAALAAREEGISNALLAAENAKKDMQNLKADNEKLLAEARAERDLMIKEATAIKDKMIADAKSEAQTQGAKMIEQAKATIESEKNNAVAACFSLSIEAVADSIIFSPCACASD